MTFKIPAGVLEQHVIALGKTGSGKSSKLRVLVEGLLDANEPVCILDVKGDWWGLKSSADGKRAGFPLVIFGGKHADVPLSAGGGKEIAELVFTGNRPCIIDMRALGQGERARFFIDLASTAYKVTKGKRWLVMSEVHNFCPKGKIFSPQAGEMLHWANKLASEGRGLGINLLADSQRGQKVHNDFLTSMETLVACKVIHKSDRDAIKDWIDGCADIKVGKQVLDSLAQLKKPEAWVWCPEIDFGPELLQFPLFKTFDSFKPQQADAPAQLKGWADVDLSEVTEKLAKVVEETKANDPAALKKKIAELERQIKTKPAPAAPLGPAIDPAAADRAYKDGYDTGTMHASAKGFDQGYAAASVAIAGIVQGVIKAGNEFMVQLRLAEKAIAEVPRPAAPAYTGAAVTRPRATVTQPAPRGFTPVKTPVITREKPASSNGHARADITRPQQKILDKLAWLESNGIYPAPKETLGAVCNVSPSSSSYQNNLGALRTAGLIDYPQPAHVGFTEAGRAAAVLPDDDGRRVHEHWLEIVSRPQRAILEALIEAHPDQLSKEALADIIAVSAESSSYQNNLGALRTLGAIDYPAPRQVALTRYVMP